MKPPNLDVTFVRSPDGDWVGMYVNGVCVEQGHSIREEAVAAHLFAKVRTRRPPINDHLPYLLSELYPQKGTPDE